MSVASAAVRVRDNCSVWRGDSARGGRSAARRAWRAFASSTPAVRDTKASRSCCQSASKGRAPAPPGAPLIAVTSARGFIGRLTTDDSRSVRAFSWRMPPSLCSASSVM